MSQYPFYTLLSKIYSYFLFVEMSLTWCSRIVSSAHRAGPNACQRSQSSQAALAMPMGRQTQPGYSVDPRAVCVSSRGQLNWLSFPSNFCLLSPSDTASLNHLSLLRDIMFLKYCRKTNSPLHALNTFPPCSSPSGSNFHFSGSFSVFCLPFSLVSVQACQVSIVKHDNIDTLLVICEMNFISDPLESEVQIEQHKMFFFFF